MPEKQVAAPEAVQIIPKSPDLLSKEEIEELLPMLEELISWANTVLKFALDKALEGVKFEGFKVVEGRSNRAFKDPEKVVTLLLGEGLEENEIYEKKLKTLANFEKVLGKKTFESLLGSQVYKPPGKPALVPVTDARPEFTPAASAAEDFNDGYTEEN